MLRFRSHTSQEKQQVVSEEARKPPAEPPSILPSLYSSAWFKVLAGLLVFLYILFPLLFMYCPLLRRHLVFLNYVSLSRVGNLSLPTASYGLPCAHNLYVWSEPEVRLGVWLVEPLSTCHHEATLDSSVPVVMYLHGNAGNRGGNHRLEVYKLVTSSKINLPVVAFDYRGFGDSTNVAPSARGLVRDARAVYDWVKQNGGSQVIVWGHSLGTAVSVALVAELCKEGKCPQGLILEAPFTKVSEEARHYPLTILHRYMPYFENIFIRTLEGEETQLDSQAVIGQIKNPILILHSEDDAMVPIHLCRQLYRTALQHHCRVSMVEFPNYGHNGLFKDPKLPSILIDFVKSLSP